MLNVGDTAPDFTLLDQDGPVHFTFGFPRAEGPAVVLPKSQHTWLHGRGV